MGPVVVTDVRGCRQTVEDRVTGYVVPPRDPGALAAAILTLLRDPDARRRMGVAACGKATREFDERVVFARICATYLRLLRRPAPGVEARPEVNGVGAGA